CRTTTGTSRCCRARPARPGWSGATGASSPPSHPSPPRPNSARRCPPLIRRSWSSAAVSRTYLLPSISDDLPVATPARLRSSTYCDERCEMIELAVAGHAPFKVERIEKDLPPPSYTAETLAELRRRHPADEFFLLMGSDGLPDLPSWHEPRKVIEQAGLVVVPR